jgi:transcriptional regulator with XRE-family HTH domain
MRTDKAFKNVLAHVGNQLAYLRLKKGYSTIKSFAQKYDLPEIQYWRIERGKANITLKSLSRILNIHRLTLNEFFCMINEEKAAA